MDNQEMIPVVERVPTSKETCMLCAEARPFGCDTCRKEVAEADTRIYVGSGEDIRAWTLA